PPMVSSSEPPPMSILRMRPALQPYQRRTARKVSLASSSPLRICSCTPVCSRTRSSTSSELVASRSAEVAKGMSSWHCEVSAMLANSATVSISRRAPDSVRQPSSSMFSDSRSVAFVELIGMGWPPRCASTTSRWTVLLPTSSTPRRTRTRYWVDQLLRAAEGTVSVTVRDGERSGGQPEQATSGKQDHPGSRGRSRLPARVDRVRRSERRRAPDRGGSDLVAVPVDLRLRHSGLPGHPLRPARRRLLLARRLPDRQGRPATPPRRCENAHTAGLATDGRSPQREGPDHQEGLSRARRTRRRARPAHPPPRRRLHLPQPPGFRGRTGLRVAHHGVAARAAAGHGQ